MGITRAFRPQALLLAFGLVWLGLGFSLLAMQAWEQRTAWRYGENRGGDLKQHYAVALMLQENGGDYRPLFRDFVFSEKITEIFNDDLYRQGLYLDRHNYRYGPFIAWISQKLTVFSYETWVRGWGMLLLVWTAASLVLLRKTESGTGVSPPLFLEAVLFLGFPPLLYGFSINQNAPLTLFVAAVSAWLLKNRREWIAGLVFGSICYKPQLMPYVAGIMLLCGQWRFALGTGFATAFWLGVGLLVCGWESHRYWVESLLEIIRGVQGDEMETNMPWKGFVLTVLPESYQGLATIATGALGLLLLGAILYFVHRNKKHPDWQKHHIFYLVLLWWLLFTPHVKAYEMVLALPLMMLLFRMGNPLLAPARAALVLLYVGGFAAAACRFVGFSPAAPLVTIAFVMALVALGFNRGAWPSAGREGSEVLK